MSSVIPLRTAQQHAPCGRQLSLQASSIREDCCRPVPPQTRTCTASLTKGVWQVTNAISRKKKEEIVEKLSGMMDQSIVMFGVRHKGVKVNPLSSASWHASRPLAGDQVFPKLSACSQNRDFTAFRRALPPDAYVMVAKNTLVGKASGEGHYVPGLALPSSTLWTAAHGAL